MAMLTGIYNINQSTYAQMLAFNIASRGNLMIFGPAGTGKTHMAQQAVQKAGFDLVYLDLSTLEAPDFIGLPYINDKKVVQYASPYFMPCKDLDPNGRPKVMLIDEVDKSKPELQYPLLELLQERSINGRALNVQSVILTGNLPDEGAFSQPVNQALANRCSIFRMSADFESWQEWAASAGINPLVIGFLSRKQELLLQPPADGDPTAYCHPSPRAWTLAARDLDANNAMPTRTNVEFQSMLIAGRVGLDAATKFRVWLEHYVEIEPMVDELVYKGKQPDQSKISTLDRVLVFAISVVGQIFSEARKDPQKGETEDARQRRLHQMVKNGFGWLSSIQSEYQIAAVKSAADMPLIVQHKMTKVPEFMSVYNNIRRSLQSTLELSDEMPQRALSGSLGHRRIRGHLANS